MFKFPLFFIHKYLLDWFTANSTECLYSILQFTVDNSLNNTSKLTFLTFTLNVKF